MADERGPVEITLDAASAEAEQATRLALRLVRARSEDPHAYERELEDLVRDVLHGISFEVEAEALELARRLVTFVEALAAVAATSTAYAAGKLEINERDLLLAIGETLHDVRRNARAGSPRTIRIDKGDLG